MKGAGGMGQGTDGGARVMGQGAGFKKLLAWEKAYRFAFEVYQAAGSFPKEEQFALVSQMRRAVLSSTRFLDLEQKRSEVGRILAGLIRSLENGPSLTPAS